MFFTVHKNKPAAVLRKLMLPVLPLHKHFLPSGSKSITPAISTNELEVIGVETIQHKVIFISTSDTTSYIAKFPSTLNID